MAGGPGPSQQDSSCWRSCCSIATASSRGRHWLGGDNAFQNFPWHWWAREASAAGRLFEPVPGMSLGLPLWVEPQAGVWYPLNTAKWPWFDPFTGFTWKIVLHYVLAAGGSLLLAWRLGLRAAGAAAAAIVFATASFAVYQIPRVPVWQVVAWYPWVAVCFVEGLRSGRWVWLPAAAALHAVQFLGGQPQFLLPTPVLCIGLGALAQPAERPLWGRFGRAVAAYLAVAVATLLMTATMWLPATGAVAAGPRLGETPVEWLTMWGCTFGESMQAVLGGLNVTYKMEKACFASTAALVALALAWGRGDRWRRWWVGLAVTGLVLTWSIGNPLGYLLVEVPILNRFRNPARYGVLYAFAAAFLVGLMVDEAGRIDPRRWRRACGVAAALLLAAVAVVLAAPDVRLPQGLVVQAVALAGLAAAGSLPPRRAAGLVLAVVVAELLWFGHGVNPAVRREAWLQNEDNRVYAAAARLIASHGGHFQDLRQRLPDNLSLVHDIPQATSFAGFPFPGNEELHIVLHGGVPAPVLAAYGVTIVCAPEAVGRRFGLVPEKQVGDVWLFRNPLPVTSAYLPTTLVPLDSQSLEATLRGRDADPRQTVAVTGQCWPLGYLPGVGGEILGLAQTSTEVTVRTRSESGTLLVLTRAWALGWRAAVDGQPAPTMRANLTLLAAPVPPGEHQVTFRYDADLEIEKSLASRAWLLWGVALLAAVVADRRRSRRG